MDRSVLLDNIETEENADGLRDQSSVPGYDETSSNREREATRSAVPEKQEVWQSFTGGEAPVSSFPAREVTASAGTERKESEMAGPASQGFFNSGIYRPTPAVGHRGLQPQQTTLAPRYGGNARPNPAREQPLTAGLNEAMRHYAMGTSPSSFEMGEVAHSPPYPVVEQPASGPVPWTGVGMSPAERPSTGSLVLTIIGAVLSLWCCLCTGIAAIVVSIKAWQMQRERKYEQVKEKRGCAWILIVVSIFIGAPTIVLLVLHYHVPGTV